MGMYTGVRCKVIIKEEYRDEINNIISNDLQWADSNIDFLKEYGMYSRASFIPYGVLAYMPDEWDSDREFDRQFNIETGLLTFQCSLKNYDSTIECFFSNVLNKITEKIIHLEVYYETWEYSKSYNLDRGSIKLDNNKFIKYLDDATD